MSAYVIAEVTITDAARMAAYREWSTRAMQEHGAEVLVRGGTIDTLEGDWTPERLVVLRFADRAAAHRFYDSETYRHARTLREGAGVMRMVVVDGVA
ncbi:DUF1330 domain-containing protein [Piscinibacter sakaiensis]|uniref:DUF1330 domain-containing protein n=1 Tax=Piscinibacter sakaiensis TaxID=1547922 RepID=A0A0K8NZD8_PISS1|nr:DUF1330 domain-containing protein [Piscinibacter sakaiensis]GAP35743.1 hypothetical protein ISF6_1516 [Piscinibacter sakaiensis]